MLVDKRALILHLLRYDEITYKYNLVKDTQLDMYCTGGEVILNKWNPKKKLEKIELKLFNDLAHLGVITSSGGNFETGERHYQLDFKDNLIETLKECILKTTNTEFETIFKDILLKVERRLKLDKINGKLETKSKS